MAIACRRALTGAACAALVLLGACAREGHDQMSWARAALERNGQIEIVAADPQSRTFTVRVKDSGELRMVRVDEVVAAPALGAELGAAAPAPAAPPQALTANTAAESASAPPPESAAPAPPPAEEPAAPPAEEPAAHPPVRTAGGALLESGPGYSIQAASGATAAAMTQSGPGFSIKASGAPAAAPPRGRLRDAGVTSAAVERRREPIICQGSRLLHIDNRYLEFDGDAVSAEDGCEIHITNSHISAAGVGVLARGANVYIDNSLIEGDGGSIDASGGAQVYITFSRFRGLTRSLDTAAFHDLGGNIWN